MVMYSNLVSAGGYIVCAPFLPLELERKEVEGTYVGCIFALYSVGQILWSPVVGKYLIDKVGSYNSIGFGLGFMGITFVCFGFIDVLEDKVSIILLASVLRLLQGMCCTTHSTACLSLLTNSYPD